VTGAAVFVDRDGVINELVPDDVSHRRESPLAVADVALVDGAAEALRRLSAAGWPLVGVSNQPAAAKGRVTLAELEAVQRRVIELLDREGVRFDDFRICFHHPAGVVPELTGTCECRKPAPGMLLDAARALGLDPLGSWMIGDTDADVLAGRSAGCRTILVENPGSSHKRSGGAEPDAHTADLAAAATLILRAGE
jgi:D-glycero-D-manno-heptose 1,7-bisphosphate phosphatase